MATVREGSRAEKSGPLKAAWEHWQGRPPQLDPRQVGLTFVDVLFALVMGQVIMPFAVATKPPAAGVAQLVLAGVLTITSWVGYHSSWNRPRWFIRFPNLPLWQFLVDVLLVIDYWLLAASVQGTPGAWSSRATPIPACVLVAVAFGLYVVWDWLAKRIRKDLRYAEAPQSHDDPRRRVVTLVCFAVSVVILIVFVVIQMHSGAATVAVVVGLTVLTVLYRVLKDLFYLKETDQQQLEREVIRRIGEWDKVRTVAQFWQDLERALPYLPAEERAQAHRLLEQIGTWDAADPRLEALIRSAPPAPPEHPVVAT